MSDANDREADLVEVRRVVRKWGRAFTNQDPDILLPLWDSTYEHLIFQGEDFRGPLLGWDEIKAYLVPMFKVYTNMTDQVLTEMYIDILGDVAWVYFRGWNTADTPGAEVKLMGARMPVNAIKGETRHTFIMRRRDGDWKIIHYHESRVTEYMAEWDTHLIPESAQKRP